MKEYPIEEELEEAYKTITNLQEEIHKQIHTSIVQKKQIKNLKKYKSRCEKAIEYIKSYNLPEDLGHLGEAPISIRELRDLLNILQGSEDNGTVD